MEKARAWRAFSGGWVNYDFFGMNPAWFGALCGVVVRAALVSWWRDRSERRRQRK